MLLYEKFQGKQKVWNNHKFKLTFINTMKKLYKDKKNAKFLGVCAGLANYFNIEVLWLRITAIVLFIFPPTLLIVLFIYIILSIVLDDKPIILDIKENFSVHSFSQNVENLYLKLETIEHGIIRLESYVASDEFEFKRKLWDLSE